jgi:hypothetical protein
MKYQARQNLSWWFNTYVLRRKDLIKPQLYHFDNDATTAKAIIPGSQSEVESGAKVIETSDGPETFEPKEIDHSQL